MARVVPSLQYPKHRHRCPAQPSRMACGPLSAAGPILKLLCAPHTRGGGADGMQYACERPALCACDIAMYAVGIVTLAVSCGCMRTSEQRAPGARWRAEIGGVYPDACDSPIAARRSWGCCTGMSECRCRLRVALYLHALEAATWEHLSACAIG